MECTFSPLLFLHHHPFSSLRRTCWNGVKENVRRGRAIWKTSQARLTWKGVTCMCIPDTMLRLCYCCLQTFHCMCPRKLSFTKMDPSCAIGFYCRTREELDKLLLEIPKVDSVTDVTHPFTHWMSQPLNESAVELVTHWMSHPFFVTNPTLGQLVWVGRLVPSVCLSVCPEHNSRTNNPKVFKFAFTELPWDILQVV